MKELRLQIHGDFNDDDLDAFARQLAADIRQTGCEIHSRATPASSGARGDVAIIAELVMVVMASKATLAVIDCIKTFLTRDRSLSISVTDESGKRIELTSANIENPAVRNAVLTALGHTGAPDE